MGPLSSPCALSVTIFVVMISCSLTVASKLTCFEARNRCSQRNGCGMAMLNYEISCDQEKFGATTTCRTKCMESIIALVTVDDNIGMDLLTCDCAGNTDCEVVRSRISMCSDDVLSALEALDNEEVISCSLARMLCDASTECYAALEYFDMNCANLWDKNAESLECSAKCNNSLNILYQKSTSAKLRNCICDNDDPFIDEDTCIRMKYNTETYCQHQQPDKAFYLSQPASADGQADQTLDSGLKTKADTGAYNTAANLELSALKTLPLLLSLAYYLMT